MEDRRSPEILGGSGTQTKQRTMCSPCQGSVVGADARSALHAGGDMDRGRERWAKGSREEEKSLYPLHSLQNCLPTVGIWQGSNLAAAPPVAVRLFPFMHVMQATGLGQGQQLPNAAGSLALLSADRLTEIEHLPPVRTAWRRTLTARPLP